MFIKRKKCVGRINGKWQKPMKHNYKLSGRSQFKISSLRNSDHCVWYSRVLERGSRGPSTVTLIALLYVAICGGEELTIIVSVKLFPVTINEFQSLFLKSVEEISVSQSLSLLRGRNPGHFIRLLIRGRMLSSVKRLSRSIETRCIVE